jgi:LacI family transcriptional regulator
MLRGIIAVASPQNYELCNFLLHPQNKLPSVVIGYLNNNNSRQTVTENHIIADDYAAGYQAAMLLLRHHHRHFQLVSSSLEDAVHRLRREGALAALKDYDIPECDIRLTEVKENLRSNGEQLAAKLACLPVRPEGLIFTQSSICFGFVLGCKAMNLNIPKDFSVVSFEDNDELESTQPPITVIRTPTRKIGQAAVKNLISRINNQKCSQSPVILHTLISRQSVREKF